MPKPQPIVTEGSPVVIRDMAGWLAGEPGTPG